MIYSQYSENSLTSKFVIFFEHTNFLIIITLIHINHEGIKNKRKGGIISDYNNSLDALIRNPIGWICYEIMKRTDPDWVKKQEQKTKSEFNSEENKTASSLYESPSQVEDEEDLDYSLAEDDYEEDDVVEESSESDNVSYNSESTPTRTGTRIDNLLEPSEDFKLRVRYLGNLFDGEYNEVIFTDQRIIFYKKTGFRGKNDKYTSLPISDLGEPFVEDVGTISKKSILRVDVGIEEPLEWKGSRSNIRTIHDMIRSLK